MMDIRALCEESLDCAKSKGWLDKPRTTDEHANLMVSEISEALEEYRAGRGLTEVYCFCGPLQIRLPYLEGREASLRLSGEVPKPEGIPIELADFAIRVCQYAGEVGLVDDLVRAYDHESETISSEGPTIFRQSDSSLSQVLFTLTKVVVMSDPVLLFSASDERLDAECLGEALQNLEWWCGQKGIDLLAAIALKGKYNRTRPHRHGNKVI